MSIRKMNSNDFDEVFKMMRDFYDSPAVLFDVSDEILKKDINDCISSLPFIEGYVFDEQNTIKGYMMLAKSYSTEAGGIVIWIEDIYIKPEYRGCSIATKFFKFVEESCDNIARIRLDVEPCNKKAIGFYKKCGYEELKYSQMMKNL